MSTLTQELGRTFFFHGSVSGFLADPDLDLDLEKKSDPDPEKTRIRNTGCQLS